MRGSECPFCGSGETAKRGEGRRLCKSRRRSFWASALTAASPMKLGRERFGKTANPMPNGDEPKAVIGSAGISARTACVWGVKAYGAAFEIQKKAAPSGKRRIDGAPAPANEGACFRPEGGKEPRGVSRNRAAIACAVGSPGSRIAIGAERGRIASAARVRACGAHIEKGSLVARGGIFGYDRLISFLESPGEAYKSATGEPHPKPRPVDSFIAELKRFLRCRVGIGTECRGICAARTAFKSSAREGDIEDGIDLLESYCFQTKAGFKAKDRCRVG